mgnify:CR=1 FL=1
MTLRDFTAWLQQFPDQDATVRIVRHGYVYEPDGWFNPSGTVDTADFDPNKDVEYMDWRGNLFVDELSPFFNTGTLLLEQIYA